MEEQKKKKTDDWEFYMDTLELEKKKDRESYINTKRNGFVSRFDDGLNNRDSVFDMTAMFKTGGLNQGEGEDR